MKGVAGDYYTGLINHHDQALCEVWLANAPESVFDRLRALHPRVYVIHNDAPRSQSVVLDLRDTLDFQVLQPHGIRIVWAFPTEDGYLRVGVMGDVAAVQERLDAIYGPNVIRVHPDTFRIPTLGRVNGGQRARTWLPRQGQTRSLRSGVIPELWPRRERQPVPSIVVLP